MDFTAIGKRIKWARENARLTQEELAELIFCSPQHISVIERGIKTPRLDTFIAIANATHTSADYLLGDLLEQDYELDRRLSLTISSLPAEMQTRVMQIIDILIA